MVGLWRFEAATNFFRPSGMDRAPRTHRWRTVHGFRQKRWEWKRIQSNVAQNAVLGSARGGRILFMKELSGLARSEMPRPRMDEFYSMDHSIWKYLRFVIETQG